MERVLGAKRSRGVALRPTREWRPTPVERESWGDKTRKSVRRQGASLGQLVLRRVVCQSLGSSEDGAAVFN